MIDRRHIEKLLILNGLPTDAPEEEIRALLVGARWHDNDVDTALVVLRENPETHKQRISAMHSSQPGYPDIRPETLNALLGIDVEVEKIKADRYQLATRSYRRQMVHLFLYSILVAAVVLLVMMWHFQVGLFHKYW